MKRQAKFLLDLDADIRVQIQQAQALKAPYGSDIERTNTSCLM